MGGAPDSSPGNERNQRVGSQAVALGPAVRHSIFQAFPNDPSRNAGLDPDHSVPQATPAESCLKVGSTTTPRGCLKSITATLNRMARDGDVEGFRAYVRSDAFLAAFSGLDPERRSSVMRSYAMAETLCEANARQPLRKPKSIDAKRAEKVAWGDPTMRAKLANAYARAKGDDEKAARILGVTLGSARLARRRYLGRAAHSREASGEPHERPFPPGALPPAPDCNVASVTPCGGHSWPSDNRPHFSLDFEPRDCLHRMLPFGGMARVANRITDSCVSQPCYS